MPTDTITLTISLPMSPERLVALWLDNEAHASFTGGAAAEIDAVAGGAFTTWEGYIEGTTLEIGARRILQRWRAADFPEGAEDSLLELRFEPEGKGTLMTLHHSKLPEGSADTWRNGWEEHYFVHMRKVLAD